MAKSEQDLLINETLDTVSSLLKSLEEAGGNPVAIYTHIESKPLTELLNIMSRNGIRFTYIGTPKHG